MLVPWSVQKETHFLAYCYQTSQFPCSRKTHRHLCKQYSIPPHSHCVALWIYQSNGVALTKLFLVYLIALLKVLASAKEIFIKFNGWPIPWFLKEKEKRKGFQKIISWQNKILIIKISVHGKLLFPDSCNPIK